MYFRVNFEVHSGCGGPFLSIPAVPVRSGPFRLVNAPGRGLSFSHTRLLSQQSLVKKPTRSHEFSPLFVCDLNNTMFSSSLPISLDICILDKKEGIQLINFNIDEVIQFLESVQDIKY